MFIFAIMLMLMLYVGGGTATYRRLGGYRLALLQSKQYGHTCERKNCKWKDIDRSYETCAECGTYRWMIRDYGSNKESKDHRKYCGECVCSPEKIEDDNNAQRENDRKKALHGVALKSYLLWPGYAGFYLTVNAQKAYLNHKGPDWEFFIEPKMIMTRKEELAKLDADIKELEIKNGTRNEN